MEKYVSKYVRILQLTPERIFCPLCGKWHDWNGKALESYISCEKPYVYECNGTEVRIGVTKEDQSPEAIEIFANLSCDKFAGRQKDIIINTYSNYSGNTYRYDKTITGIKIPFTVMGDNKIGKSECQKCQYYYCCNFVTINDRHNNDHNDYGFYKRFDLEFKFEYKPEDFYEYLGLDYEKELRKKQKAEEAKYRKELKSQAESTKVKEETTMANNFYNMNSEFGPNKDANIASTPMGVAVKNGNSWRVYDKKKKKITDAGDMQLGNLPIFIMPTTELNEGDLIKVAREYYFIAKVDNGSVLTLNAKTGEMKNMVLPIKNLFGFSCYSKVITIDNFIDMGGDFDAEKFVIMSMMCGQPGHNVCQMNQLLLMMLLKYTHVVINSINNNTPMGKKNEKVQQPTQTQGE